VPAVEERESLEPPLSQTHALSPGHSKTEYTVTLSLFNLPQACLFAFLRTAWHIRGDFV
jgi:hypothetical protein